MEQAIADSMSSPETDNEFKQLNEKRFIASTIKVLKNKSAADEEKKTVCEDAIEAIRQVFPELDDEIVSILAPEGDPIEALVVSPLGMPAKPYEALHHDIMSKPKATDEQKKQAEAVKAEGNDAIKASDLQNAILKYTAAINLDPHNAVYYCNRAAAYTKNTNYMEAIDDCNIALLIDPKYDKAYARIAIAYQSLNKPKEAKQAIDKALEMDPNNEQYKINLESIEQSLALTGPEQPAGNIPGFPQGGGGMESMFQFLNDPTFMNAAQEMMKSQDFQQHIAGVVSSMQGGAGAPPTSAFPGMPAMDPMQAMQLGQKMFENLDPSAVEAMRESVGNMIPKPPGDSTGDDQKK